MKMKRKNQKSTIVLAIITCILLCINIVLIKDKLTPKNESEEDNIEKKTTTVQKTKEEEEQEEIKELKTLGERDRMERYFGKYIECIESQNYLEAYDLLNQEFKQNYFKTIEEYTKYIEEKYPEMIAVEYTNIERQGQYYVLFVKITDLLGRTDDAKTLEQKIVIYEKDYNDFELSFSV